MLKLFWQLGVTGLFLTTVYRSGCSLDLVLVFRHVAQTGCSLASGSLETGSEQQVFRQV